MVTEFWKVSTSVGIRFAQISVNTLPVGLAAASALMHAMVKASMLSSFRNAAWILRISGAVFSTARWIAPAAVAVACACDVAAALAALAIAA